MLNEVIQTVHRLVADYKKHKVIVCKDENGNRIHDNSPDKEDMNDSDSPVASDLNNSEITGVSTGVGNTYITTGVDNAAETAETGMAIHTTIWSGQHCKNCRNRQRQHQ